MNPTAAVVGAGPAGLSAALGLARAGFTVDLWEQRKEWQGRVCGSFLSPEGMAHLRWLGLDGKAESLGAKSAVARLYSSGGCAAQMSLASPGTALPRKILEEILMEEAKRCGVRVHLGACVQKAERTPEGTWSLEVRREKSVFQGKAEILVGADGRFSNFRRFRGDPAGGWFGWQAEFRGLEREPGELSLHFFPKGYFGTLTFRDGTTNVSALVHSDWKKGWDGDWPTLLAGLFSRQKELAQAFARASQATAWRGVGALPFGSNEDSGPGLFLCGDAAAVCDPFMGEGISRALSAGPDLFRAFAGDCRTPEEEARRRYGASLRRYALRWKLGGLLRLAARSDLGTEAALRFLGGSEFLQSRLFQIIH